MDFIDLTDDDNHLESDRGSSTDFIDLTDDDNHPESDDKIPPE